MSFWLLLILGLNLCALLGFGVIVLMVILVLFAQHNTWDEYDQLARRFRY